MIDIDKAMIIEKIDTTKALTDNFVTIFIKNKKDMSAKDTLVFIKKIKELNKRLIRLHLEFLSN